MISGQFRVTISTAVQPDIERRLDTFEGEGHPLAPERFPQLEFDQVGAVSIGFGNATLQRVLAIDVLVAVETLQLHVPGTPISSQFDAS
ncbi:hypothetical protein [Consotaella aegiceratis]|uniref:hypothetical protein n=1 Tax=Consotaella aegiceratis TaxID=3097961 RepID=UPI002F41FE57